MQSFPDRPLSYRPDIDGLRAVAVLSVVAYHAGVPFIPGGFVGVDIFFVISGFLITNILLSDLNRYGRIDFFKFYSRRARRILPTLALVIAVTCIAACLFLSPALGEIQNVAKTGVFTLLFSANIYFGWISNDYFATRAEFQPFLHTWSLSVEEQFYLLWPITLWAGWAFCRRYKLPVRWLVYGVIFLMIASGLAGVALESWQSPWAFYSPITRAWELGIGGLLAVGVPSIVRLPRAVAGIATASGSLLVIVSVLAINKSSGFPTPMAVFPVVGSALIIFGGTISSNNTTYRLLSTWPMVQVGLVSYAWYLWHWPALAIVRIVNSGHLDLKRDLSVSVLTLAVSFLTLYFYERPLRFYRRDVAPRKIVAMSGVGIAAIVLAVFGMGLAAKYWPLSPRASALLFASKDFPPSTGRCLVAPGVAALPPCLVQGSAPRVVIWGDSMADRLSPAVTEWMRRHQNVSVALEEITKPACPPLLHELPTAIFSLKPYYECRAFNDLAVGRLAAAGAAGNSGVILSAAWWPRATDFDLRKFGSPERRGSFDIHATDTEQSLQAMEAGLRATLQEIARDGLRVLIVLGSPILVDDRDGRGLDAPECIYRTGDEDLCSMALATHRALTSDTRKVLKKVSSEFKNAAVFDPIPILCTETRCPAEIDGVIAYTDYEHLSATMSRRLSSPLAPYLAWLTHSNADLAIR